MDFLKLFYENKGMVDAVKASQILSLKEEAVKTLMEGKDAKHLADSIKALEEWYSGLKDMYEPKKKSVIKSSR